MKRLVLILLISGCGSKPVKDCKPVVEVPKNYNVKDLTDIKFTEYSHCKGLWWWE